MVRATLAIILAGLAAYSLARALRPAAGDPFPVPGEDPPAPLPWTGEAAPAEELPLPPAMMPPEPATAPIAGVLAPRDVVALLPQADPDGWFSPAEVLAFVQVESAFRPNAYRFEPRLGEASYGLMQVLASSARDRGLGGAPELMFDPLVGLQVGIRHAQWGYEFLARRLGREPAEHEWVGAYNAGVGNVLGGYIPWAYVQRWRAARARFGGAA